MAAKLSVIAPRSDARALEFEGDVRRIANLFGMQFHGGAAASAGEALICLQPADRLSDFTMALGAFERDLSIVEVRLLCRHPYIQERRKPIAQGFPKHGRNLTPESV
jgi:hypothetical protein